jgi:hypothetical protein
MGELFALEVLFEERAARIRIALSRDFPHLATARYGAPGWGAERFGFRGRGELGVAFGRAEPNHDA